MSNSKPEVSGIARDILERKLKQENQALKSRLLDALKALETCQYELDTAVKVKRAKEQVTPIKPREIKSGAREATWVALASDFHIEETVESEKVNGVNSYNLAIARHRVERYFSGVAWLVNYHSDRFKLRDGILWLGGDLITGYLREENLEDNGCSPVQAIAKLQTWLSDGIRYILKHTKTEKLRVVCNSGNHGRLTYKVRPATREANSIEWLLYQFLAREFADNPRVEFQLPHGVHSYAQIYNWSVRFTHGDAAKYGGGVGGVFIPIRKALYRWNTVRHADWTNMGHFHQYSDLNDLVINGSLIGYNTFALEIGANYEDPKQAFYLVDSKRGKTMPASVWVKD
jgi:hypothetical protein